MILISNQQRKHWCLPISLSYRQSFIMCWVICTSRHLELTWLSCYTESLIDSKSIYQSWNSFIIQQTAISLVQTINIRTFTDLSWQKSFYSNQRRIQSNQKSICSIWLYYTSGCRDLNQIVWIFFLFCKTLSGLDDSQPMHWRLIRINICKSRIRNRAKRTEK